MNQNPGGVNPFDPFAAWRQFQDGQMETWSKAMIEYVNSDAYAQATGRILDAYLSVSAPFREAIEKSMAQTLARLNMPTRDDVTSLAQRLTNVEMRLDDLDAKLDDLKSSVEAQSRERQVLLPGDETGPLEAPARKTRRTREQS